MNMVKRSKTKVAKIQAAQKEHENWLRSLGIDPKKKRSRSGIYDLPDLKLDTTNLPPTSDQIAGNGHRKDQPKYTGSYIKGIGTTHKSNAVPVTSRQQAIDISKMRRQ